MTRKDKPTAEAAPAVDLDLARYHAIYEAAEAYRQTFRPNVTTNQQNAARQVLFRLLADGEGAKP